MNNLQGQLKGRAADFSGHTVELTAVVSTRLSDSNTLRNTRLFQVSVDKSGDYNFTLPSNEKFEGPLEIIVRGPSGRKLTQLEESFPVNQQLDIPVRAENPVGLTVDENKLAKSLGSIKIRVTLHDLVKTDRVKNRLIMIWGKRRFSDNQLDPLSTILDAQYSDPAGKVVLTIARDSYAELMVSVPDSNDKQVPLQLSEDGLPPESIHIDTKLTEQDQASDCSCQQQAVPRDPEHDELIGTSDLYATDKGTGSCVQLAIPNRTLEEYQYHSLIRTTDPYLFGVKVKRKKKLPTIARHLLAELAFGAEALDSQIKESAEPASDVNNLRLNSEAYRQSGLLQSKAWRDNSNVKTVHSEIIENAADLSEETLRHALSDPDGFTPVSLMTAQRKESFKQLETQLYYLLPNSKGRRPISKNNMPKWDGLAKTYQASTIAHGHILEYRQTWKADGYSLGDLLYSLPLAPCQKKQIVILDWDRREIGRRRESRTFSERLTAGLSRDRDVSEIVNSTVTESIRAGSKTNTWGAAGGIGLGVPFTGGFFGLGVAGGGGGSSSSAWQNAARHLSASSAHSLRDRTNQAAAAVRSQRGTVVQSVNQRESLSVTAEVVANHNHCHATTMEYFEVLKHYKVEQVLSSVKECLFIPLKITSFDEYKALRWRDILKRYLRSRRYRRGFSAIHRILTGYADADYPLNRYADELVEELSGEFKLELSFTRPREVGEDEDIEDYLSSAWNFWNIIFGANTGSQVYKAHMANQSFADKIWNNELASRLARNFVDNLRLKMELNNGTVFTLATDFTLVSNYRAGREHLISFRVTNFPTTIRRRDIKGLRLETLTEVTPNSTSILRFSQVNYKNKYRTFAMIRRRRLNNELKNNDSVFLSTRSLSRAEEFNPREKDLELRSGLLKHLNEFVERYHQIIWWRMDSARRFMLLDGFIAPNSNGRSVASVVDNKIIDVIGNCLVMPVAPGYILDPTVKAANKPDSPIDLLQAYTPDIPIPAQRISVPTKGVYAESVMGACNSCEEKDEKRFWRWEEEPCPDQPTAIGTTSTDSRRSEPLDTSLTDFQAPIIGIQNAPAAPDPTPLSAYTSLLGQKDLFKDISGLEQNQKNALAAFQSAMATADSFGKLAAAGAKASHAQRQTERTMKKIESAQKSGLLNEKDSKHVTQRLFGALNSDLSETQKSITDDPDVKKALNKVTNSKGEQSISIKQAQGKQTQSVDLSFDNASDNQAEINFTVDGIVPALDQVFSKGCWAASLTMLKSWQRKASFSIETLLAEAGDNYLDKYRSNSGLSIAEIDKFVNDFQLREISLGTLSAAVIESRLKERGPLWVIADEDSSNGFSIHARVIIGIQGDATAAGTQITYNDPATGQQQAESLKQFINKMEQLSEGITNVFGGIRPQVYSN